MEDYPDTVAFARSTWRKVAEFQQGLRALEARIPISQVRDYLASGLREPGVPGDIYDEIDRLRELRAAGIRQEMRYARAQAAAHGIELSQELQSGQALASFLPRDLLEKVPSLGIYRHFLWYGEKE